MAKQGKPETQTSNFNFHKDYPEMALRENPEGSPDWRRGADYFLILRRAQETRTRPEFLQIVANTFAPEVEPPQAAPDGTPPPEAKPRPVETTNARRMDGLITFEASARWPLWDGKKWIYRRDHVFILADCRVFTIGPSNPELSDSYDAARADALMRWLITFERANGLQLAGNKSLVAFRAYVDETGAALQAANWPATLRETLLDGRWTFETAAPTEAQMRAAHAAALAPPFEIRQAARGKWFEVISKPGQEAKTQEFCAPLVEWHNARHTEALADYLDRHAESMAAMARGVRITHASGRAFEFLTDRTYPEPHPMDGRTIMREPMAALELAMDIDTALRAEAGCRVRADNARAVCEAYLALEKNPEWRRGVAWPKFFALRYPDLVEPQEAPAPSASASASAGAEPDAKEAPDAEYIFRRAGDHWRVRFEGKETMPRDSKGMQYLRILLANPEKSFLATDLFRQVNPAPVFAAADADAAKKIGNRHAHIVQGGKGQANELLDITQDDDNAESGYQRSWDGMPATDEQTIADVRRDLETKQKLMAKAKERGESQNVKAYEQEIRALKKYLAESSNIDGKPRKVGDAEKRNSDAVGRAITRALEKIAETVPAFDTHIKKALGEVYAYELTYRPAPPVNWRTF